jgi:hypothetical protein
MGPSKWATPGVEPKLRLAAANTWEAARPRTEKDSGGLSSCRSPSGSADDRESLRVDGAYFHN